MADKSTSRNSAVANKVTSKEANKLNKKQQLLEAALSLFVQQGIHATSTASIAKTAGVANGTLFHHFPSKDALVLELYKSVKQDFALKIVPVALDANKLKQQAKSIWQQAINWAIDNAEKQQFCSIVMQYQPLSAQDKAQILSDEFGYLQVLINFGQQHHLIANHPLALMLDIAHGQFLSSSQFFISHPELAQDKAHQDAAFEMFWQAFEIKA
jgi:AcrR family transcriptional regulator